MPQLNLLDVSGRDLGQTWWKAAWDEGLWAASWHKSIADLSPQQAAWTPAPGRHSIWQIVLHIVFWREYWLRKIAGGPKATDEELARDNWPVIAEVTAEGWNQAQAKLLATHEKIAAQWSAGGGDVQYLLYFIPHDAYHVGQISVLRALQGLPPIE